MCSSMIWKLEVVADKGYYRGEEIKACDEANIITYVPKSNTSGNRARGQFGRDEFKYLPDNDEYECPAGERLIYRFTREEAGKQIRRYWSSACPRCPIKERCTTGDYRRVSRWEHEPVVEAAERRLEERRDAMAIRRAVVEHPYRTILSLIHI